MRRHLRPRPLLTQYRLLSKINYIITSIHTLVGHGVNEKGSEGLSSVKLAALASIGVVAISRVIFLVLTQSIDFSRRSLFRWDLFFPRKRVYKFGVFFFQRKWKWPGLVLVYVFLSTNLTEKILVHFVHTWLSFRFRFRWTVWTSLNDSSLSLRVLSS